MLTYSEVSLPVFSNAEQTSVDLFVKFSNQDKAVAFTASPYDTEEHGRELYVRAVAGDFGKILPYVKLVTTLDMKQKELNAAIRNMLEVKAQELGFDSIAEAMTYCDEPSVPLYQKQALALRAWRSGCWAKYDEIIASNSDFLLQEFLKRLPTFIL